MITVRDRLAALAAGDEPTLKRTLSDPVATVPVVGKVESGLDPQSRALVRLAALIAADAGTTSLRLATERAGALGVSDRALVEVLLIAGAISGSAQTVTSAPRLGLALDLDLVLDPRGDD